MTPDELGRKAAELEAVFEAAGCDQRERLAPRISSLIQAAITGGQPVPRSLRRLDARLCDGENDSEDLFENMPV